MADMEYLRQKFVVHCKYETTSHVENFDADNRVTKSDYKSNVIIGEWREISPLVRSNHIMGKYIPVTIPSIKRVYEKPYDDDLSIEPYPAGSNRYLDGCQLIVFEKVELIEIELVLRETMEIMGKTTDEY